MGNARQSKASKSDDRNEPVMNDPFEVPRTARAEMVERIAVLRRQAEREKKEAADLRERAEELDASADLRLSIASEYEAIAEKVDR